MALPKRLQQILTNLEAEDTRYRNRAKRSVQTLYKNLNFRDLERLLETTLKLPKAQRMKAFRGLMEAFDEAVTKLKLPPATIRLLLKQAVEKQILTTDSILTALDPKFKFNQSKDLTRKYAARVQKDFDRYWSGQQADFRRDIQSVLRKATRLGWSPERTRREIQARTGVSQSRAELIAVDQTQKARAYADRERQKALGIKRYVWRTVGDNRVRREHQTRNGQVFAWEAPPRDGHPGWPVRCRCRAVPYLGAERMRD